MVSQNKLYVYGAIGLSFLNAVLTLVSPFGIISVMAGLLGAFFGAVAVIFLLYGYIAIPFITKRTGTILLTESGYEIPPSEDVIVKKAGNIYYASVFLGVKIYESATEKSMEENIIYNEYFERAISNLKSVTKISYLLYVEDISKKRRDIESKRAEAQLRLARERDKPDPDVIKLDKYEREVGAWDLQLAKLIKGVKPMGVIASAMTTAASISKEGAIAKAKAQANELRSVLANALNVEIVWLTGDEMKKCFEWETFYPVEAQELEEVMV